jgi:mannose-6-phosphate isomerase-like protein (cupin superfamily)
MTQIVSTKTADHYAWGDRCDGWHLLRRDDVSVIQEEMPSGTSEVAHFHKTSRQFFYILSGTLAILLDGVPHTLTQGQGIEIAPGATHRISNDSPSPVRFLVISVPPSHGDRIIAGAFNDSGATKD